MLFSFALIHLCGGRTFEHKKVKINQKKRIICFFFFFGKASILMCIWKNMGEFFVDFCNIFVKKYEFSTVFLHVFHILKIFSTIVLTYFI